MKPTTTFHCLTVFILAAALLIISPAPLLAGGDPETEDITGIVWEWQKTRYNNDEHAVPSDPSHFTIIFNADKTINIRADCNHGGGKYSLEGKAISVEVTHTTQAMCPPGSLDQTFIKNLNSAGIYFFSEGDLYLDLKYDTGTMKFGR